MFLLLVFVRVSFPNYPFHHEVRSFQFMWVLISLSDLCAALLLQMLESQVDVRQKEVEELQKQSQALSQEGKGSDEVDGQRISVEKKFHTLQAPLQKRRENLMASREIHQFNRDVEDEIVSPVWDQTEDVLNWVEDVL